MYPTHYEDDSMLIRKVIVGNFDNNCYWVACKKTASALLVDAASEPDRLMEAADGLKPERVLITHGHWDHIQAVEALRRDHALPIGAHRDDADQISGGPDFEVRDGETITVGELTLKAHHTPGHTPGGLCFVSGPVVFSGDTLFPGGPGKTSGPEEFARILVAIETRLFTLPSDTIVYPGHGLDTTIGSEEPNLPAWKDRGW